MTGANFTTHQPPVMYKMSPRGLNTIAPLNRTYSVVSVINATSLHSLGYEVLDNYASTVSPQVDILVGTYLILVQITSVFFNGLVLGISFSKRKYLKPTDMFVVWLAASDIGHPLTAYPMVITSSFMHGWTYGDIGCQVNGFTSFFFGINSMMTLTTMSFNRYLQVTHTNIARHNSRLMVGTILTIVFLSSLFWSISPLMGWGRYGLEPFKTSCTLVWDNPDSTFVTSSFVFVLAIPVTVMFYSYGRILCLAMTTRHRRSKWHGGSTAVFQVWRKKEMRLLKITLLMCLTYVIFWTPYAIVAMMKSYASHIQLSPVVSLIPCLAAKTSHVADPIIYCFLNKNFSRYIPGGIARRKRSEGPTVKSPTAQTAIPLNAVLGVDMEGNKL